MLDGSFNSDTHIFIFVTDYAQHKIGFFSQKGTFKLSNQTKLNCQYLGVKQKTIYGFTFDLISNLNFDIYIIQIISGFSVCLHAGVGSFVVSAYPQQTMSPAPKIKNKHKQHLPQLTLHEAASEMHPEWQGGHIPPL